ncbi:MAG: M14 family metallocarboxypeptidase [Pseudomonadota bacterium]
MQRFYPIGTPGTPWTDRERQLWFDQQRSQRNYREEVASRLTDLAPTYAVRQFAALDVDPERFPLFAVTATQASAQAPWVLITGGVHGYETSGVQGALDFLHGAAADYLARVNLVVLPCVSPWAYEMVTRWNPHAVDPNRSFRDDSPAQEAAAAMAFVHGLDGTRFAMHLDLHETTDSDEDEFRPALAARDGEAFVPCTIPDGFYTVGDADRRTLAFQQAIVDAVAEVTHIAPADDAGMLIGTPVDAPGIIHLPCRRRGLCAGMTDARLTTTTEVYPDSPRVDAATCNKAQVAAVCAALDYLLAQPWAQPRR